MATPSAIRANIYNVQGKLGSIINIIEDAISECESRSLKRSVDRLEAAIGAICAANFVLSQVRDDLAKERI